MTKLTHYQRRLPADVRRCDSEAEILIHVANRVDCRITVASRVTLSTATAPSKRPQIPVMSPMSAQREQFASN